MSEEDRWWMLFCGVVSGGLASLDKEDVEGVSTGWAVDQTARMIHELKEYGKYPKLTAPAASAARRDKGRMR